VIGVNASCHANALYRSVILCADSDARGGCPHAAYGMNRAVLRPLTTRTETGAWFPGGCAHEVRAATLSRGAL